MNTAAGRATPRRARIALREQHKERAHERENVLDD